MKLWIWNIHVDIFTNIIRKNNKIVSDNVFLNLNQLTRSADSFNFSLT